MEEIEKIANGIAALEIQGARNVAIAGLKALRIAALETKAGTTEELVLGLSRVSRRISLIRITEPGLRSVLASVLQSSKEKIDAELGDLREFVVQRCDAMLETLASNVAKIIQHGGPIIKDGSTIYTHCHSSSVTKLIVAESRRKSLRVICSETRPRWQGRKTAQELGENGVDTTLFVDSAAHMYMGEADLVLIGADAVGGGLLYNKIGSFMVIRFSREQGIPAYSVCETMKFDPLVGVGYVQPVEQRPPSEVIEGEVPFKVRNPAFETVPIEMLEGIITEEGIVRPDGVDEIVSRYDHLIPELKNLVEWDEWEDRS